MSSTNGTTPGRSTRVTFDIAETVAVSPFQGWRRRGGEIARGKAGGAVDDNKQVNIRFWPTGAITLAPLQTEISNLQEYAILLGHIVAPTNASLLTNLMVIPSIAIENQYRQNPDLVGMAYSGNINTVGAPFIVRKIPAGGSWNEQITSGVPSVLSGPDGSRVPDIPVDRVGESIAPYPANQGFFLNWSNPGSDVTYPKITHCFYFGQYSLSFSGTGLAYLYEYVRYADTQSQGWQKRAEWRYARAGQISGTAHSMGIWPHFSPEKRKYIVFSNGQVDIAQVTSSFAHTSSQITVSPGDFVYEAKPDARYVDSSPFDITTSAPIRFDIRRDWRMSLQISTLGWPTSGMLIDAPGSFQPDSTSLSATMFPIRIFADVQALPGTGIASGLIDAASGAAYDPNNPQHQPAARFDFTGDGNSTPILWGYNVNRDSASMFSSPGQFSGGNLRSVSVAGYCGDPSQQSAHVQITDVNGDLRRLHNRGQLSVRIDVTHTEGGKQYVTPIFRGYALRPKGNKQRGPSQTWYDFSVPMVGMWMRLSEPTSGPLLQSLFYNDPLVPDSQRNGVSAIPWKVTDAIRYLIACAGFSAAQINIPDLPMRLWPGISDPPGEFDINPNTNYAEFALRLCRNFLGGYLLYSEVDDYWTLIGGTSLSAAPVYNFTTAPPRGQVDPSSLLAYPQFTCFVTRLETEMIAAEYNSIQVVCPMSGEKVVQRTLINFNGYTVPGSGITPDPDSPDYIGHIRPTVVVDSSLYHPGDVRATQRAVDWTCQRLYDFCCHGQRLAYFTAPLVFVLDPATGNYRMPRFMDPITINGLPYQVKSCTTNYHYDGTQTMEVEAIQPMPGQYVPPGNASLTMFRKATTKHGERAAGTYTESNRLGNIGVSPSAEHRHRSLPVDNTYAYPMQDGVTGQLYYVSGY